MDRLAAAAVPGADGLLFHPYLQGERAPYWDPLLRGDFVGMTFRHDRGHFVRALYEGIAFRFATHSSSSGRRTSICARHA